MPPLINIQNRFFDCQTNMHTLCSEKRTAMHFTSMCRKNDSKNTCWTKSQLTNFTFLKCCWIFLRFCLNPRRPGLEDTELNFRLRKNFGVKCDFKRERKSTHTYTHTHTHTHTHKHWDSHLKNALSTIAPIGTNFKVVYNIMNGESETNSHMIYHTLPLSLSLSLSLTHTHTYTHAHTHTHKMYIC